MPSCWRDISTGASRRRPHDSVDKEVIGPGACVLRGFVDDPAEMVCAIADIAASAPFRHLSTPSGAPMRIAMTNCGRVGWVNVRSGYGYAEVDPLTGHSWPSMPAIFTRLATHAAAEAGFADYTPDVCLINRYTVGSLLHMHKDRNGFLKDMPVVSVSLGLPATFRFGGQGNGEPPRSIPLVNGDVVVWGGPSRMNYHGVLPLEAGVHPLTGNTRFNLTFRAGVVKPAPRLGSKTG
nr:DNA oxidative demethylase AlkB [Pinirhizobacter soli]